MLSVPPVNPITNAFTTRLRYAAAERAPKKVDSNESVTVGAATILDSDGFNLKARSVKRYSCDGSRGLPGKRLANHSQEKSERKTFHGSLQTRSSGRSCCFGHKFLLQRVARALPTSSVEGRDGVIPV